MGPIPKAGYYYANKIARITIQGLENVMGKNESHCIAMGDEVCDFVIQKEPIS